LKIDLTRLMNNFIESIDINEVINFDDSYLTNTAIRRLSDVKVTGSISKTMADMYYLKLLVAGTMILPCAITLEDVEYNFGIEINEILSDIDDEDEKYLKINGNCIDILPIIWQNIVLEVPFRVVKDEEYHANVSGNGWRLITEEERQQDKEEPKLEGLKDLLND
jgi:uncharacterized protein